MSWIYREQANRRKNNDIAKRKLEKQPRNMSRCFEVYLIVFFLCGMDRFFFSDNIKPIKEII